MTAQPILRRSSPRGFTLLEVMFVSALMALLVMVLSAAWSGMGRPSVDAVTRCRVAQEANLAAASLAADLAGSQPGAVTGQNTMGRAVGRIVTGNSQLSICFDGGPSPDGVPDWTAPDTVIIYQMQADKLIRQNVNTGDVFTVANHIAAIHLVDEGNQVRITLTFAYRDLTQTYTLVAKDP